MELELLPSPIRVGTDEEDEGPFINDVRIQGGVVKELHNTELTTVVAKRECFPGCGNALGKLRQRW